MDSTHSVPSTTEHRLFHVAELLEAILHALPTKDLLLDMRVCKTWKRAIENSTKLQKDLFFLADGDAQHFVTEKKQDSSRVHTSIAKANPLLEKFIQAALAGKVSLAGVNGTCLSTASLGAEPSWSRMLLTQPPVARLAMSFVYFYGSHDGFHTESHGTLERTSKLQLVDFLQLVKGQHGLDRWSVRVVDTEGANRWYISLSTEFEEEYFRAALPVLGWETVDVLSCG